MVQIGATRTTAAETASRSRDLAKKFGFFFTVGCVDLLKDRTDVLWNVLGVIEEHVRESVEKSTLDVI